MTTIRYRRLDKGSLFRVCGMLPPKNGQTVEVLDEDNPDEFWVRVRLVATCEVFSVAHWMLEPIK